MKVLKWAIAVCALCVSSVAMASQPVADFAFKDIYGKQHRFSDYKGKWVIVNYWATYCGPCVHELPELKKIAHQYRGKAVVLGMDAGETPHRQMRQFMRQKGINYTVAPTQDSTMFSLGLIYGVPTTYIVSPQGHIVDVHMGAITANQLARYIDGGQQRNRQHAANKPQKEEACETALC